MRYFLLSYLSVCLILIVIFILLSFNAGFGYVYIQWHGWQLQSNLFLLLMILLTGYGVLYALGYLGKALFRRNIQKYQIPKSFQHLHPYERLGILWLLHAERVERQKIISTYQSSVLLSPLIQARLWLNQQETGQARQALKQIKNPLFELAELLKIDIALAEQQYAEALDRLEFLTVQPLSIWLQPVQHAYQVELQDKWMQLSQTCPWWIFKASHQPQFNTQQNILWFQALLNQSDHVSQEEQQLLQEWFEQQHGRIQNYDIQEKILLLKLMGQFDLFNVDTFKFAHEILQQRFIPEVLYIWLDQALNHAGITLEHIDQQIQGWQQQYASQPSLSFAKWHVLQRQQKFEEAEQVLSQYPDDPYMAYLRLQDSIKTSNLLQDDLRLLLYYSRQDFKFNL